MAQSAASVAAAEATRQVPNRLRVCILGGGAAGFYSAVACGEQASRRLGRRLGPGDIAIIERSEDVLRKVSISGGGRCNVTHAVYRTPPEQYYPRGAPLVTALGRRHGASEAMSWFAARGVQLKTEKDGRVFPVSDDSASIVDCLKNAASELGIETYTSHKVTAGAVLAPGLGDSAAPSTSSGVAATAAGATPPLPSLSPSASSSCCSSSWSPRFRLNVSVDRGDAGGKTEAEVFCERLIICCGSAQKKSTKRLLESLGATVEPTVPSLFSLLVHKEKANDALGLEGTACPDAEVKLILPKTSNSSSGKFGNSRTAGKFKIGESETPSLEEKKDDSKDAWASGQGQNLDTGDIPSQRGPILFTKDGLSGPALLRLSAWSAHELAAVKYCGTLIINWAPFLGGVEEAAAAIRSVPSGTMTDPTDKSPIKRPAIRKKVLSEKSPWPGQVPTRLWERILLRSEGSEAAKDLEELLALRFPSQKRYSLRQHKWQRFESEDIATALAKVVWPHLTSFTIEVAGRREHKQEFVTAGGVSIDPKAHLNWDRMELWSVPGVHFAGEVLNVDGVTGGFNFQGCWSSGYVAGRAAAEIFSSE